ncbi:hypothetical protein [Nocardioides bizhenqiangii]|uniref:DUF1707 domain-containing protein n=1 Tax=Nocardioides bizhenqiangii TaxID=3095076 RepID=A0ABZ0ZUA2_9ACTN|nr:hypothetical protein [Nocardioides sp. HM61]WQQ27894.1 hypothetical protein SHK19_06580 [Nocardioides sp. HM61]
MTDERMEAIQAVVDRVTSWQDGATEDTVAEELRRGVDEVGVEVSEDEVRQLADAIEDRHGAVSAAEVLGRAG